MRSCTPAPPVGAPSLGPLALGPPGRGRLALGPLALGPPSSSSLGRPSGERGQAVPLVALLVVLAAGAALVLVLLGGRATELARLRTAADAAALAGAVGDAGAAREAAQANGARLVSFVREGAEVAVEVAAGDARARARARARVDATAPSEPPSGSAGLDPALVQALARAGALLGEPVPITSGWRSPAEQQRLWDQRATNPFPVARPGTSAHERGRAVDVPRSFVPRLRSVAAAVGLCHPLPATDPVHFALCPGAARG